MVRIRMKSLGRRHRPFFRICAMDSRAPRDGRAIEELGYYDPMARDIESRESLNVDRIRYWLSVGAQPSEKVAVILRRHGVEKPAPGEHWELPKPPPAPEGEGEGEDKAETPTDATAEAPAPQTS